MKSMSWRNDPSARGDGGMGGLGLFRSEMNRLVDRFFTDPWSVFEEGPFPGAAAWAPSFEVSDDDKEVTIRAEIPGVDPKEVELSLVGSVLTISGEKKETQEQKGKQGVTRSEIRYGAFRRSFELPDGLDASKITAEHANGILSVRIPKQKPAEAKKIPIATKQGSEKPGSQQGKDSPSSAPESGAPKPTDGGSGS